MGVWGGHVAVKMEASLRRPKNLAQTHVFNPLAVKGGLSELLNVRIAKRPNIQRKKRVGGGREAYRI